MPIKRVTRLYGANHFIVSQTNPAALPFIDQDKNPRGGALITRALKNSTREWLLAGNKLLSNPAGRASATNRFTTMLGRVLSQTYTGDINILPPRRFHNPIKLLSGRNSDEVLELIQAGERACWPNIERIRTQTHISRILDEILQGLEEQVLEQQPHCNIVKPAQDGRP